jgi:RNA polymerase sigma-70 factor (ECF subfamily)
LLACLNNYVRNEWDKERSQKRGGGIEAISIDIADTEQRYGADPVDAQDPAKIFEQRWARVLLTQVLEQLKERCASNGKADLFASLQPYLTGEGGRGGYTEAAAKLQMSEGAVRVAASRLRDEFRELLRAEVGQTVGSPADIDDEIRQLFGAFRTP